MFIKFIDNLSPVFYNKFLVMISIYILMVHLSVVTKTSDEIELQSNL